MKEWFTPAVLTAMTLPGLPATERAVQILAKREGWRDRLNAAGAPLARKRKGRGGGWEYHFSVLPSPAQARLVKNARRDAGPDEATATTDPAAAGAWAHFGRMPDKKKATAKRRLVMLQEVHALRRGGWSKDQAVCEVAARNGVGKSSVYNWLKMVERAAKHDWLPYLAPRHVGRTKTVECDPAAWEFLKRLYLSDEKREFAYCYDLLKEAARENGWTIPSPRTLERRLNREIPLAVRVFWRKGAEAAADLYPYQERDRTGFHALQAVNADGHKWDVFVKWPGIEKPVRPVMLAVQDLYSNKFLGWRIDLSENSEMVRLAFKDMLENYGIPEMAFLDNGRGFAAKCITGGTPNRYRFKVKAEEPLGILPALGVDVRWTKPYSGRSKPIERSFKELCQRIAKHPKFEGAYTGNKPDAKPESYMSRAIDLDTFLQVVGAGMRAYNARPNRNTRVCGRMKSFDQAFDESYGADSTLIRKCPPDALNLCLMAAESVKAGAQSGSVRLLGNRFWAEELVEYAGQPLTLRFDPEDLHVGVHVYQTDGRRICFAECWEAVGFADAAAAKEHSRKRAAYRRATREAAEIERSMTLDEMIALMPDEPDEAPVPETKTVRLVQGNAAVAANAAPQTETERMDDEEFSRNFSAGLRLVEGGLDD